MSPATELSPAPVFAALGDETRLRLVGRMSASGPQSIARLTGDESITRQAVTRHLQVLEGAGLASSSRHGRETIWQLEPRGIAEARRHLDNLSRQWDTALDRLRAIVEQ